MIYTINNVKKSIIIFLVITLIITLSGCDFTEELIGNVKEQIDLPRDEPNPEEIEINSVNFPDPILRESLKSSYDKDQDGVFSKKEQKAIKSLTIYEYEIKDMTGLELLPNVQKINIGFSISKQKSLAKELYIEGFPSLEILEITNYHFEKIVIKNNPMLKSITSFGPAVLAELEIQDNPLLENIKIASEGFEVVNLENNISLKEILFSAHKDFSDFTFIGSPELSKLQLQNIQSASECLDFTEFPKLEVLEIANNNFAELDLSQNTELMILDCSNNKLKKLNLDRNIHLAELNCSSNFLENLDVSQLTELVDLRCMGNQLVELDVSANHKLEKLDCSANQLQSIDVRANHFLKFLLCRNNYIFSIQISTDGPFASSTGTIHCADNFMPFFDLKEAAIPLMSWSDMRVEKAVSMKNTIDLSELIDVQYLDRVSFSKEELKRVHGEFNTRTGILTFDKIPEEDENGEKTITYLFDTQNETTEDDLRYMPVVLVMQEEK